jgi:hypothetical protein
MRHRAVECGVRVYAGRIIDRNIDLPIAAARLHRDSEAGRISDGVDDLPGRAVREARWDRDVMRLHRRSRASLTDNQKKQVGYSTRRSVIDQTRMPTPVVVWASGALDAGGHVPVFPGFQLLALLLTGGGGGTLRAVAGASVRELVVASATALAWAWEQHSHVGTLKPPGAAFG